MSQRKVVKVVRGRRIREKEWIECERMIEGFRGKGGGCKAVNLVVNCRKVHRHKQ